MPVDAHLAKRNYDRYVYMRDNGHNKFVTKADTCNKYFAGDQWEPTVLDRLKQQRRPAITINKIISTMSTVMGEQIYNRSEIGFRPRKNALESTADTLSKVFKQISDVNQLDWKRSDMFADGIITSRGFLDIRIAFDESMQGNVVYDLINPKNVVIDPDAEQYDPDTWNDLFVSKWLTWADIAVLYNAQDAEMLKGRGNSALDSGFDIIDYKRDTFGGLPYAPWYGSMWQEADVLRNIRVLERQYKQLDKQKHFVSIETGDTRPIPKEWDDNKIALFVQRFGFGVIDKLVKRIRWTVTADNVVLHDDWSPYKHFTVVPYFPYFRHGETIGLVENLLGPQDVLNKVTSQELHVVNTTANSGWKVARGALTNMSIEELEQRGAETGLVIEVNGDVSKAVEKIQPNQVPQGLDRISFKAEDHIKGISGVSDSMQGFDREDVAAKAIQAKRQAGSTNIAKPLDSLIRTDYFIARNTLDLVQEFYTEERILAITTDRTMGESEQFVINQVNDAGEILNDLTLGEYDVVISSVPLRETLEDSQFEQASAMREMGIAIPDSVMIENSRLRDKKQIIEQMDQAQNSPQAQQAAQLQQRAQEAEIGKVEAETRAKDADTQLKTAKAGKESVAAIKAAQAGDTGAEQLAMKREELGMKQQAHEQDMAHKAQEFALEMHHTQESHAQEARLREQQAVQDRVAARVNAVKQQSQPKGKEQ